MNRVVITGIGVLSPFGVGKKLLFESLISAKVGLKYNNALKTIVGCIPEGTAPDQLDLSKWPKGERRKMSRGSLLALIAAEEAIKDSGLEEKDLLETGVDIGMGIADLELIAESANLIRDGKSHKVTPYFVPRILTNMPAGHVSIRYGMRGANLSSCTACATGLHAIGDASTFIAMGRAKKMLAGAVEGCINPIAITGFQRCRALSASGSRPFDRTRDGFILSEGAALLVLEKLEDAQERNAHIYAEVRGYGVAGDAFHLTLPAEDGVGGSLSMQRCLNDAHVNASDITYVNAHATSTPAGDRAEAHAIAALMPGVPVSSIKGHIGHTLGAAGAIEVAATAMCIDQKVIVGNVNLNETDINENVNLLRSPVDWEGRRIALVNSFGFGGSHATLCLFGF
ncbi:3-oxoacyl-[acyl-carrier-protein] synthase, mitochondrial [Toxocara canis]|nr:3-oxoacyl-[acyl-carrier-protein] synthase, mitochondrial [Toxocara canis]